MTQEDESDPPRRVWSSSEIFRLDARTVFWLAAQAIFFTAWLVTMNVDVQQLKKDRDIMHGQLEKSDGAAIIRLQTDHDVIMRRVDRLDEQGTRALAPVMKDIDQLGSANTEQDRRITRNDARIDDLIKQQIEINFWIIQFRDFVRAYAHPPTARPSP